MQEDNGEEVRIGKVIHELAVEVKKNTEISIYNIKIDKITDVYLVEIKKSDADVEAVKWQVLFYLKILKRKGKNTMIDIEESLEFEKRKQEIIINSIEMLSYLYKKGLISLENYFDDSSKFKDKVYDYYKKGLKLIIDGKSPQQVTFMLEYEKMKWIKNSNNSAEDLLLITIIQGIIPCLQKADFDGFYDLCCVLFSKKQINEIGDLLTEINSDIWDKDFMISKSIDTILNILEGCHLYSCSIEQYMKKFNQKDKLNEVKIIKDFTLENLTYNWFIEFEDKEIYFDIISSKNKANENIIKTKMDFANKNLEDNCIFVTALIYKENIDEKVSMEENSLNNIDDFLYKSVNCTDKDILDSNRKVTMIIRSGKITFGHMAFIIFKGV